MVDSDYRNAGRRSRSLAQLERDAAMGRVGRTRRWVILAAGALTAAFAALVSAALPGRTLGAQSAIRTTGTVNAASPGAGSTVMPPLASPDQLGLQAPGQAPQAAPPPVPTPTPSPAATPQDSSGGGAVVSGGS